MHDSGDLACTGIEFIETNHTMAGIWVTLSGTPGIGARQLSKWAHADLLDAPPATEQLRSIAGPPPPWSLLC